MPRALRIEIRNGVYYVTSRALEGQGIVRDKEDCGKWFERLDAVAMRRQWRVFAFVVMASHHHLLVETPEADLSAGMHDLNSGYATGFNHRHGRRGPLFWGGPKAILIEPGYRYWDISRHIHLNPVRLGHAKRPQAWPFGSCMAYVGTAVGPAWLDWQEAVQGHGATMAEAREAYERFLAEGVEKPPISPLWAATPTKEGALLGSPEFVARVQAWLEGRHVGQTVAGGMPTPQCGLRPRPNSKSQIPTDKQIPMHKSEREVGGRPAQDPVAGKMPAPHRLAGWKPAPQVEAIEKAVCGVYGVEEGRLREKRRRRNEARAVALYLCRKWTRMTTGQLGARFGGVSAQAASKMAAEVAQELAHDTGLGGRIRRCEAELGPSRDHPEQ